MFCPNCGKSIPEEEQRRFCPYCGKKLTIFSDTPKEKAEEVIPEPQTQAAAVAEPEPAPETVIVPEPISAPIPEPIAEAAPITETVASAESEPIYMPGPAAEPTETVKAEDSWIPVSIEEPKYMNHGKAQAEPEPIAEPEAFTVPEQEQTTEAEPSTEAVAEPEPAPAEKATKEPQIAISKAEEGAPKQAVPLFTETTTVAEPKKKKPVALIAVALVAILAVAGYFIYQNLPGTKAGKLLSEADSLMGQDQYEEAISKIDQARSLKPDDIQLDLERIEAIKAYARYTAESGDDYGAYDIYATAVEDIFSLPDEELFFEQLDALSAEMSSIPNHYAENGEYIEAINLLDYKRELVPELVSDVKDEEIEIYKKWTEDALNNGDFDDWTELQAWLTLAMEESGFSELREQLDAVQDKINFHEYDQILAKTGAAIKEGFDTEAYVFGTNMVGSSILSRSGTNQKLMDYINEDPEGRTPYIAKIDEENSIGIYYVNDIYYVYIGEYDGDQRSGKGYWTSQMGNASTGSIRYVAKCEWKNDKPNGPSFSFVDYTKDFKLQYEVRTTSTAKDGLYEGETIFDYGDDRVYYATCENGICKVLDTVNPNGEESNVIAYNKNKTGWLNASNLEQVRGIEGFLK